MKEIMVYDCRGRQACTLVTQIQALDTGRDLGLANTGVLAGV